MATPTNQSNQVNNPRVLIFMDPPQENEEKPRERYERAITSGDFDEVDRLHTKIFKNYPLLGIGIAVFNEGELDWEDPSEETRTFLNQCGQKKLIDYFINQFPKCVDYGLETAINISDVNLINYLISRGANPQVGLREALEHKHRDLEFDIVQYLLNRGGAWNKLLLYYVTFPLRKRKLRWIREVIQRGATNLDEALICIALNYRDEDEMEIKSMDAFENYFKYAMPVIQLLVTYGAKNAKKYEDDELYAQYKLIQEIIDYNTTRIQSIRSYFNDNVHDLPIDVLNCILLPYISWELSKDIITRYVC